MSNAKNAFERQGTAKELDEETGLYYYGARYLDPKYSRWISADPAIGEYMGKTDAGMGGIYNHINLNLYHYAGNNPIRYIDPTGLEEDVSESKKQLKRLKENGEELFHKGTINGINLYLENGEDGCFVRVTVIIDGKKYVVDPFYHKSWLSISGQDDWYSCQYPKGTSTQPAHDAKGNLIAPATMKLLRTKSGYTGTMPITEYAQGWLKNYDKVKRDNKKNNTNNDPYIWSGK